MGIPIGSPRIATSVLGSNGLPRVCLCSGVSRLSAGGPAHGTHRGAISAAPEAVLDTGIPRPRGHMPKTKLVKFTHSVRLLSGGRGWHAGRLDRSMKSEGDEEEVAKWLQNT